jgi:trimeric autotransporter adhesin
MRFHKMAVVWPGIALLSACSLPFEQPFRDGQQAYVKASNPGGGDFFGAGVALSGDGSTLAVSAPFADIVVKRSDQSMVTTEEAGAVYVFIRKGTQWSQQAYIKASNIRMDGLQRVGDEFGTSIALSRDGSILAVGAKFEAGATAEVSTDFNTEKAGAVYVFTRSGGTWSQQAYLKAFTIAANDLFGFSIALSGDGSTLAVGAPGEDSAATGTAPDAGAVYLFTSNGTTWSQEAYIKASDAGMYDEFGASLALSDDGSTLAVGSSNQDHTRANIECANSESTVMGTGAVYVFTRTSMTWSQQTSVKASNPGAADCFGASIALSGDGSVLAVGAPLEDSAATGIGGDQLDNMAANAGAVYVFTRNSTAWSQQAYIKPSNTDASDGFGNSVALSGDGSALAVGASQESSAAVGVGGAQSSNADMFAGAVYVFGRAGATWSQQAYVKASNTGVQDHFGASVALAGDGSILAVGAEQEDGAALGINGDQDNDGTPHAGAVYVFR